MRSTPIILYNAIACLCLLQSDILQARPAFDEFKYETNHCEPLRLELLASLIMRVWQPMPPARSVRYDLYTRHNPHKAQTLPINNVLALQRSEFNASWPVRIIIHGWSSHALTCSCAALKDAYLSRGDFNIILFDWSDYAMNINYALVVLELSEVAEQLNAFTRFLNQTTNVPYDQMYLIGHSAGSHIAGLAGKRVPSPAKYGVIYALDPAGPIHVLLHNSWRLMPNDAHYVEAIHTDTALFGYDKVNIAHASFFGNWGLGQPHCLLNITVNEPQMLCDHFSALYYFAESLLRPQSFGALRCNNLDSLHKHTCRCSQRHTSCHTNIFMGGEPAVRKSGVFYFSTHERVPFGYSEMVLLKSPLPSTVMQL